jgi:hypothetical protein
MCFQEVRGCVGSAFKDSIGVQELQEKCDRLSCCQPSGSGVRRGCTVLRMYMMYVHYDVQRCERENIGDSMTGAKRDFDLVIMKE